MFDPDTAAGSVPSGSPAPLTSAGRKRLPHPEITRSEPGPETLDTRPGTGLSGPERDRASALIRKLRRRKRDPLPPGAKLSEAEKEAIYTEAAQVMSRRLKRPVSLDAMRLVAASMHAANPHRRKRGIGLTEQHHALLRAEAEAMELDMTEVMRDILNAHFEIVPEA